MSKDGLAVLSVDEYTDIVRAAEQQLSPEGWDRFHSLLATQTDRRSLARLIKDDVRFPHKTGTVDGVRHDSGWLDLGEQRLEVTAFTDSLDWDEYVDHPACVGMGYAMAWSLKALGRRDILVRDVPEPPTVLLGPVAIAGAGLVREFLSESATRASLRSEANELSYWTRSLEGPQRNAWSIVRDGNVIGLACLYGAEEGGIPSIGIYIGQERDRGLGLGRAACETLLSIASARGIPELLWAAAVDNERSARLALSLGFVEIDPIVGGRSRDGVPVDERRFLFHSERNSLGHSH